MKFFYEVQPAQMAVQYMHVKYKNGNLSKRQGRCKIFQVGARLNFGKKRGTISPKIPSLWRIFVVEEYTFGKTFGWKFHDICNLVFG